jgi:hypothetical protein
MAIRSKTPSAPAKRGKKTSGETAPDTAPPPATAPTKAKGRRKSVAAEQPEAESALAQETPDELAAQPAPELPLEAPAASVEPEPERPEASATSADRTSRALDALKTLGEVVSEGIDTLRELRAEMREMSGRLDQLAASMPNPGQAVSSGSQTADDYQVGRDRDPGDAVPPGVAVMSPTPLSETDEAALHSLEELPKRGGRQGKRGQRTKT